VAVWQWVELNVDANICRYPCLEAGIYKHPCLQAGIY